MKNTPIKLSKADREELEKRLRGRTLRASDAKIARLLLLLAEGFTYDEIADFVDCPVGTVRSRLHRARKMLFAKLYKYANEKGYVKP